MLIGIFSDIHDHLENLRKTLDLYKSRNVTTLICCGDFCSPIPARIMGSSGAEIHCVFGNNDGDRFSIAKVAAELPNLKLYGEHAELEVDDVKIAVTHYPFYARALARTGDYKAVFSGHTHVLSEERFGDCLWLNPGDVMGLLGKATCAIYNTQTNTAEIITI